MAERTFKVKGIEVQMWKTSFKIDGMVNVFWPTHITDNDVRELVAAVYDAVEKKAIESANRKVAENVYELLKGK